MSPKKTIEHGSPSIAGQSTPDKKSFTPEQKLALQQVDTSLHEANAFLSQWQKMIDKEKARQLTEEIKNPSKGYRDTNIFSPEEEWLQQQTKKSLEWYKNSVAPARIKQKLKPLSAHGTDIGSLFGSGVRAAQDNQGGVLKKGFLRGDTANVENYELPGGQGGWWHGVTASSEKESRACWIILSPEQSKARSAGNQTEFSVVFPDPRTHKTYLKNVRTAIENGETIVPHRAWRLDMLLDFLQRNKGKMPEEIEKK